MRRRAFQGGAAGGIHPQLLGRIGRREARIGRRMATDRGVMAAAFARPRRSCRKAPARGHAILRRSRIWPIETGGSTSASASTSTLAIMPLFSPRLMASSSRQTPGSRVACRERKASTQSDPRMLRRCVAANPPTGGCQRCRPRSDGPPPQGPARNAARAACSHHARSSGCDGAISTRSPCNVAFMVRGI
jgi:hypothetical protein